MAAIIVAILTAIFVFIYLPESPKFLYLKGEFVKSRESLEKIAEFNGVTHHSNTGFPYKNFKFVKEIAI